MWLSCGRRAPTHPSRSRQDVASAPAAAPYPGNVDMANCHVDMAFKSDIAWDQIACRYRMITSCFSEEKYVR